MASNKIIKTFLCESDIHIPQSINWKAFTRDTVYARPLYQLPLKQPTFKLLLLCNTLPPIPHSDQWHPIHIYEANNPNGPI